MLVARKSFLFNTREFKPGDVLPDGTLDKYQVETFNRAGLIVERPDVPKPVVRKKAVEVKPLVEVETGE